LRPSDDGPAFDEVAVDAYRERLADLEAETGDADRTLFTPVTSTEEKFMLILRFTVRRPPTSSCPSSFVAQSA
jgi:hypothetical protein